MKYNILLLACVLFINFSCAQDLKPLDEENDNSILVEETNYEMELIFEDENIIWSIEFIDKNSVLAAVKSGSIFKYNDGVKMSRFHVILFLFSSNNVAFIFKIFWSNYCGCSHRSCQATPACFISYTLHKIRISIN